VFYGTDLAYVHDAGFGRFAEGAAAEVVARCRPPGLVVELGCGTGITAELLLAAGFDVLGVDRSAEQLSIARSRAPRARFVQGRAEDAEVPPATAILAIGEVLGYEPATDLATLFGRVDADLMLFDLAGPERTVTATHWEGDGWAIDVDGEADGRTLTRRIVTHRDGRTSKEVHQLRLHDPGDVEALLHAAGFTTVERLDRYGEAPFPAGLVGFAATR
jgi:SAM-dependent methyltransferase